MQQDRREQRTDFHLTRSEWRLTITAKKLSNIIYEVKIKRQGISNRLSLTSILFLLFQETALPPSADTPCLYTVNQTKALSNTFMLSKPQWEGKCDGFLRNLGTHTVFVNHSPSRYTQQLNVYLVICLQAYFRLTGVCK